jgi:hypothetical protein
MNRFFVAFAVVAALTGSAFAKNTPVPPNRPASISAPAPIFNTDPNVYGAVVKDGQVIVRAPLGSDVQVDVDGRDLDVTVTGKDKTGFSKILPWNWTFWR